MDNWCVYVIKLISPSIRDRLYKIWKTTKDPDRRIKQIRSHLPYDIEVIYLYYTNNYWEFEKILHEQFNKQRIKWEWFKLSETDIYLLDIIYKEFQKDNLLYANDLHELKKESLDMWNNILLSKCIKCRKTMKSYVSNPKLKKFCSKECLSSYNKRCKPL